MCIYCTTNNYRKIYENHNGPIPKDNQGRTYEIHHIDGDHSNNNPSNLVALTIQEHYDVHKSNQEWGACRLIADRMGMCPTQISALASLHSQKMLSEGTHPFQGGQLQHKRLSNGTHHFQGQTGSDLAQKRNARLIAEGVFYGKSPEHSANTRERNRQRMAQGTHQSQIHISCVVCKKSVPLSGFKRWHGDNCKMINSLPSQTASLTQKRVLSKNPNPHFSSNGHSLKLNQGKSPIVAYTTCPHCNKAVNKPNAQRWHFDNCKSKGP